MEHIVQTPFTHQTIQLEDKLSTSLNPSSSSSDEEEEIIVWKPKQRKNQQHQNRGTAQVCIIQGYIEEDDVPTRTKSLTDDDLVELKGCFDLGFGFCYHQIPQLFNTLPALELCYSLSQKFLLDDHHQHHKHECSCCGVSKGSDCSGLGLGLGLGSGSGSDTGSVSGSESSSPVPTWKISSPGDHPDDVKARLKFWAQAVACTVKLCS